jgi:hypothetical protein
MHLDPLEYYDASRQFAAFRLVLLNLQMDNQAEAIEWRDWLHDNYPDQALSDAVDLFISKWQETHNSGQSCVAVRNFLKTHKELTGIYLYSGYANPTLTTEDACPLN